MPSLIWSRIMTANELGDAPLEGWQFERVPASFGGGAFCAVLQRATTTGVRASIFTGSQNIQQRSNVPGGGTIGETPVTFNTPSVEWLGSPDDLLAVLNDEVAGGTPTVDGIITIEPM